MVVGGLCPLLWSLVVVVCSTRGSRSVCLWVSRVFHPLCGGGRLRGLLLCSGCSCHVCVLSFLRCRPCRNTRLSGSDRPAVCTRIFGRPREPLVLVPVVAEKEVNPSQFPTSIRTWSRTTPSCYSPHHSPVMGGSSASYPTCLSLRDASKIETNPKRKVL